MLQINKRFINHIIKPIYQKIAKQLISSDSDFTKLTGEYQYRISYQWMFGNITITTPPIQNLVTSAGRTYIHNLISNLTLYMAVGTGSTAAALGDTTLGTETTRKIATGATTGSPTWKSTFTTNFTSTEINTTTEVGLLTASTGGTLLTHSVHSAISIPSGASMDIRYSLMSRTATIITGFTLTSGKTYTYEIAMASAIAVQAVDEDDTDNGYSKQSSTTAVENTAGSYYHDTSGGKLYIHTTDGANPNTHTIIVTNG